MKWTVSYDKIRYTARGVAAGQEVKRFTEEADARRYFSRICSLGIPATFAIVKKEHV